MRKYHLKTTLISSKEGEDPTNCSLYGPIRFSKVGRYRVQRWITECRCVLINWIRWQGINSISLNLIIISREKNNLQSNLINYSGYIKYIKYTEENWTLFSWTDWKKYYQFHVFNSMDIHLHSLNLKKISGGGGQLNIVLYCWKM